MPAFVTFSYTDPGQIGYGHNVQLYSCLHKPSNSDETLAYISANKHVECVDCHIRVPHGGKVSRLIAADNTGGMPGRYYPSGNGSGTLYMKMFIKTSGSYSKSNCYSTTSGCTTHGSITGESW